MVTWTESSRGSIFLCLVRWWLGAAWYYLGSCPKGSNGNELLGVTSQLIVTILRDIYIGTVIVIVF